jgi:CheY-like chemotaxis protein
MKIMIVDDNEGMRKVIKGMFDGMDVEFIECEDGGEAIGMYSQTQPEWVFMDLSMNYVDGITAGDEIRSIFPDARIVIVTEYDDLKMREEAKGFGAFAYVLKENLSDLPVLMKTILS